MKEYVSVYEARNYITKLQDKSVYEIMQLTIGECRHTKECLNMLEFHSENSSLNTWPRVKRYALIAKLLHPHANSSTDVLMYYMRSAEFKEDVKVARILGGRFNLCGLTKKEAKRLVIKLFVDSIVHN